MPKIVKARTETDTMGSVLVPGDRYWGAQTQRSLKNFEIGEIRFAPDFIRAYARVKVACAVANRRLGLLDADKAWFIELAAREIVRGELDGHFPLVVFQTGSGTQTHMNVNEVIANRAAAIAVGAGKRRAMRRAHPRVPLRIHPNDDVNMSQSTNDTFPTAMNVAAVLAVHERLLPALARLERTLAALERRYARVVKLGRTHLQDAVPMTFGDEISGWKAQVVSGAVRIKDALKGLLEVPLGGTAIGTGLNTTRHFAELAVAELARETRRPFRQAVNRFESIAAHDAHAALSAALRVLAGALLKIANDVRWLASGPRAGLGEITIPVNEPGSSIMPGKSNPTQAEALSMVAAQVYGNDAAVAFAASQGAFELNAYKPILIHNVLESIRLLADGCASFEKNCLAGLAPVRDRMRRNAESSLMLATALGPHIGYENAARVVKNAFAHGLTLKEAARKLGLATSQEYEEWVDLEKMARSTR